MSPRRRGRSVAVKVIRPETATAKGRDIVRIRVAASPVKPSASRLIGAQALDPASEMARMEHVPVAR
jgi:predicted unusual protein kinase regulating ubiquinone biosynthesis (AarF/ABC1/UbiB family)